MCRCTDGHAHIFDLPDDCLGLIFDKVASGGNMFAIWALKASCTTLRNAVAQYPAHIALEGKWTPKEIEGGPPYQCKASEQ